MLRLEAGRQASSSGTPLKTRLLSTKAVDKFVDVLLESVRKERRDCGFVKLVKK